MSKTLLIFLYLTVNSAYAQQGNLSFDADGNYKYVVVKGVAGVSADELYSRALDWCFIYTRGDIAYQNLLSHKIIATIRGSLYIILDNGNDVRVQFGTHIKIETKDNRYRATIEPLFTVGNTDQLKYYLRTKDDSNIIERAPVVFDSIIDSLADEMGQSGRDW